MVGEDGTFRYWMQKVEADLERMEDKWQKSVDDIKATIRSEVSELKAEPIAELRRRVDDGYRTLGEFDNRLRDMENHQNAYTAASGVVGWLIKTIIGISGVLAGAFGWEHIRH